MDSWNINLKDLLEAGCHFGHQARRWHPRMKKYLYGKREGVHIFDLVKTKEGLEEACDYMYKAASEGKQIVMVSTKRQAQSIVRDGATRAGVGHVTERWLGGTLTNFSQIKKNLDILNDLKRKLSSGSAKNYTKKEQLLMQRKLNKIDRFLGGISSFKTKPDVLFVIDSRREEVAVKEAIHEGIPVVGIADSNCDPEMLDVVIPANDDAVKSIQLIVGKIIDAIIEGRKKFDVKKEEAEKKEAKKEK